MATVYNAPDASMKIGGNMLRSPVDGSEWDDVDEIFTAVKFERCTLTHAYCQLCSRGHNRADLWIATRDDGWAVVLCDSCATDYAEGLI